MVVKRLICDGFEIGRITNGIAYIDGEVYELGENSLYEVKTVTVPGVMAYKKDGYSRVSEEAEVMELISQKGITALVRDKFDKLYTAIIYETVYDIESEMVFTLKPFSVKFDDSPDEPKRLGVEKRWIIIGEGIITADFI